MIYNLFRLALVAIPFTSIAGVSFLGESQHELSAYIFLAALMASFAPTLAHFRLTAGGRAEATQIYILPWIAAAMLTVIALSLLPNITTIKDNFFQGRSGLEKFISSTALVCFGFAIATLTYFVSARRPWDRMMVYPMALSVLLCAAFSAVEMTYRWTGALGDVFSLISAPVYGDIPILHWDTRLRSVAFEPPDFANSAGYIWPWLLGAVLFSKGSKRLLFLGIWLVLNVMIVLSEARTSLVVIVGMLAVFAALRLIFLPATPRKDAEKMILPVTLVFFLVVPAALIFLVSFYDDLVFAVVSGDRVSNTSRLASMTAAFRMFMEKPVFGFGFGQYAFHVKEFLPAWGFTSWEIRFWFLESFGYWPAAYSIYARFAADLGILGLVMWSGIWLWLAHALLTKTMAYRQKTGELPFAAYPLILSCFCVLLAGIPCDSVRAPMIWVTMGLSCRYLYELRLALKPLQNGKRQR